MQEKLTGEIYDQLRFWRTRRRASLGFLRTTIHSMMDVARDKPYLQTI
jgi:hypothetical protein